MAENDTKGATGTLEAPKGAAGKTDKSKGQNPAKAPEATDFDPSDAPKLGEPVFYVLSQGTPNAGKRCAAIVTRPLPTPGMANLTVFPGRFNDFASATTGLPTLVPDRGYDANGAPGTWHRAGDPAEDNAAD